MSVKEKTKKDQDQSLSKGDFHEIILYNDDINTFDHVIDVLIKVCDHTATQAEQCALIVHYKVSVQLSLVRFLTLSLE